MTNTNDAKECSGALGGYPSRPPVAASILVRMLGTDYMMPAVMLPMMDCDRCEYMRIRGDAEEAAGLHCYMFRDKPDGDRCGQMKIDG